MVEELVFCIFAGVESYCEGGALLEAVPVLHWQ